MGASTTCEDFLDGLSEPSPVGSPKDVDIIRMVRQSFLVSVETGSLTVGVLAFCPAHSQLPGPTPHYSKGKDSVARIVGDSELGSGNICLRSSEEDRTVFPGGSLVRREVTIDDPSIGRPKGVRVSSRSENFSRQGDNSLLRG